MEIIQTYLYKNSRNSYDQEDYYTDWQTAWLYYLLTEDEPKKLRYYIGLEQEYATFNGPSDVRKLDQNLVAIGNGFEDSKDEIALDKNHLFELIDQWEKLTYTVQPSKIVITREGNRFTIEGTD